MKIKKLLYAAPLLIGAMLLSEYGYTRLDNFSSTGRAWDPVGPGVTSRKDCSACHSGGATIITENTTNRIFKFDTGQTAYVPGQTYTINFKIMGTTTVGFSATVLKNSDNSYTGTLINTTDSTKLFTNTTSNRVYVNHVGYTPVSGSKEYSFQWTAPAVGTGPVTFYFASLTSDNVVDTDNDTTYQNSYVITEKSSVGLAKVNNTLNATVSPNPSNGNLTVSFDNKSAGNVQVTLISLDGKEISNLFNEQLNSGAQELNFDLNGKVSSGIYFIRVSNGAQSSVQKVLFN